MCKPYRNESEPNWVCSRSPRYRLSTASEIPGQLGTGSRWRPTSPWRRHPVSWLLMADRRAPGTDRRGSAAHQRRSGRPPASAAGKHPPRVHGSSRGRSGRHHPAGEGSTAAGLRVVGETVVYIEEEDSLVRVEELAGKSRQRVVWLDPGQTFDAAKGSPAALSEPGITWASRSVRAAGSRVCGSLR